MQRSSQSPSDVARGLDVLGEVGQDGPRKARKVGLGEDLCDVEANLQPTLPGDLMFLVKLAKMDPEKLVRLDSEKISEVLKPISRPTPGGLMFLVKLAKMDPETLP